MTALKEPLRWYHYHVLVWRDHRPSREQGDCLAPDRQAVRDIVLPALYAELGWSPVSVYYMGSKDDYDMFDDKSVDPRLEQMEFPF